MDLASWPLCPQEFLRGWIQPVLCYNTPVLCARASRQQALFERHVASCSLQNWKYWVFSRIMQPLLLSYDE